MAHRFIVPDSSPQSSPAPSTPDKTPGRRNDFYFGDNPTTTPAGPPPSSAASFTPAGAPSESYLGSSIMRGVTDQGSSHYGGGSSRRGGAARLFSNTGNSNAPLGRSIAPQRQPSGLSRQFSLGNLDNDDEEEDEDEDAEGEDEGLFKNSFAAGRFQPDNTHREIERVLNQDMDLEGDDEAEEYEESDAEGEEEDNLYDRSDEDYERNHESGGQSEAEGSLEDTDMFLNMRHDDRPYGKSIIGEEETDLLMLTTPAATKKMTREAEAILRQSSNHVGKPGQGVNFKFGQIAKSLYTQHDIAAVTEPGRLILGTESLISGMYTEGVDTVDNEERMDASLANVTEKLLHLWESHLESLPQPEGEGEAAIGPEERAEPFKKAYWIAHIVLRLHHERIVGGDDLEEKILPLPEILLDWMHLKHNLYPDQVQLVFRHRPSPASHSLYWQTVRNLLLRGRILEAVDLLEHAGWEHVRRGSRGESAYTGQALKHVQRFARAACEVLQSCPAVKSDWDIWNSNWTLFRIKAAAARKDMTMFAEGAFENDPDSSDAPGMSNMARKASSQLPWDVYENLLVLYGIILGNKEAIIDTAQDWCEATIGMLAWWSTGVQTSNNKSFRDSELPPFRQSGMQVSSNLGSSENYFERLSAALDVVTESDLAPDTMNAVEVALACVFEGNVKAVLGIIRMWSLPIACAVAEIASLGHWLPPQESAKPMILDSFDMEDLAVLNIQQSGPDEVQGIKDSSLECYARQLAGIERLSPTQDGWEVAMQVLGRMDVPEKSEETIGELLRDILKTLDENSSETVDKMWKILNDLGMINYAEETTEVRAMISSSRKESIADNGTDFR